MSVEPPSPYAPGVAVDGEHEAQVPALASRWLAVLASLFVQLPLKPFRHAGDTDHYSGPSGRLGDARYSRA